jgi:hypothetical protein
MALSAAEHTFNEVGTREDLSDLITNISPTDTVFTNMLRKDKANNTLTEWQMDSLRAANTNARLEGDTAPTATFTPTVRVQAYTQIFSDSASVSGTEMSTTKAGRGKDSLAYTITKKTKEIKRDKEWAYVNQAVQAAGSTTVGRKTRGLAGWIDSNYSIGTDADMPAFADNTARTPDGERALTEALLKSVVQQVFSAGGDPDIIMTNPIQRQVISGFANVGTSTSPQSTRDVGTKRLVSTISIYESDFGDMKIVANRFQDQTAGASTYVANQGTVYVMESGRFADAMLRPWFVKDLPANGDFEAKQIISESALKVDSNKAHGSIRDLTQ